MDKSKLVAAMAVLLAVPALSLGKGEGELEALKVREDTPAFRRALVVYQTLREMQEQWHALPSCRPLVEVMDGYQELFERSDDPATAAGALDQALQLTFEMLPQDQALAKLWILEVPDPVRARSTTFGNPARDAGARDGVVEIRGLELGELTDSTIVPIRFEVRSLTGRAERLALDLRVMNNRRNQQTSAFFEVPASGWKRLDATLGAMFAERRPPFDPWGYRVLPGYSLVRATFGSVPAGFDGDPHSDVAFDNRFHRFYWVREGRSEQHRPIPPDAGRGAPASTSAAGR